MFKIKYVKDREWKEWKRIVLREQEALMIKKDLTNQGYEVQMLRVG